MIIKNGDKYQCLYCEREYVGEEEAMSCRDRHDLILVPIAKNDLGRLLQFMFSGEENLISPELFKTLQRYNRNALRRESD